MRILILDTNYEAFMHEFWAKNPDLPAQGYERAWRVLIDECFGTADFYSHNLRSLGHEAQEVIANDFTLQSLWARENGVELPPDSTHFRWTRRRKIVPWVRRERSQNWMSAILRAQFEAMAPDVVYVQDLHAADVGLLGEWKKRGAFIAGQIASPLATRDLSVYDVVFSSFPHFEPVLRACKTRFRYFKIGFESRVLEKLGAQESGPIFDAAFGGGLSAAHSQRTQFLESVARAVPLDVWGYGAETLAGDSPLLARHHGTAWGLEMYRVLRDAKISLNIHIDVAQNNANNMRLYEATGVGSLLLTDQKDNLGEIFEVGTEVVAYENAEDCIEKLRYLLEHETQRAAIALAGQNRTLKDHSYARRMEELSQMLAEEIGISNPK